MQNVYITSLGAYLPNNPIANDEMENFIGKINGKKSQVKDRVLKQNGITQRHYALNVKQESTHTNAQLAVKAVEQAILRSSLKPGDIELLSTGTTQADLPVPGFASMVHAGLDFSACEVASFQSV
ncbi:MAG: 3-oxoacyl-ACP synthase, partial [Cyclobacteriaceae bacterium]|nr:3-oxoacyl-ACP synthase [Cyclobacteriaceae bacterium]